MGEHRYDDPRGLGRNLTLEAGDIAGDPEAGLGPRCKKERLALVLVKIPKAAP